MAQYFYQDNKKALLKKKKIKNQPKQYIMLSEIKTNTKGQILCDSIYMRYPASSIHREEKQNRNYQWLGWEDWGVSV